MAHKKTAAIPKKRIDSEQHAKDVASSQREESPLQDDGPIEIRKYSNRRLYDTSSSSPVTLADLASMIRNGTEIRVVDASTGEDLTRTILLQIILENEQDASLLPVSFLRRVIETGSEAAADSFRTMFVSTMELFSQLVEEFQDQVSDMTQIGSTFPLPFQWMAFLNRAMEQIPGRDDREATPDEGKKPVWPPPL
ncbi:MAG: hypothetical protein J7M25_05025 [Deltaproteobacteria bacterium]|nr:hypothetical protein [Deltaproteobacteria bacterium]